MLQSRESVPEIHIGFLKENCSITHYRVRGIKWNTKTLDEQEELPYEVVLDIDMDNVNIYMESELEKHISNVLIKEFGYTHNGWKTHCRVDDIVKSTKSREEKRLNREMKRLMFQIN